MTTLFFSYSHRDETMRDELEIHLAMLKRQGVIDTWHDRRLIAGDELDGGISEQLEAADLILLLVSPYFLASSYCYDVEMTRAMQRHQAGTARVIPVILDPCDWHAAPFGKMLATPTDGKPISKHANIHDAFLDVVTAIKGAAKQLHPHAPRATAQNQSAAPATSLAARGPRSSNLRVTRTFSDHERDEFLDATFEYLANFFEGSLSELSSRNPQITTRFKRESAVKFTAFVYREGKSVAECAVQIARFHGSSITYSHSAASDNSYNESLSIEEDGHALQLRPMGMGFTHAGNNGPLTQHGAAEFFWAMLVDSLQQRH